MITDKLSSKSMSQFMKELSLKQESLFLPEQIVFELTPLCNFRCKMCYVRLDNKEYSQFGELLSAEHWIDIAEQAFAAGVMDILFTGGEVFFRKDFRRIYEAVYDMGFYITILSNGYLLDNEIISWLSKRKPRNIRITIYGASNDTYRKVCGIDDGYSRVLNNIRQLKSAGIHVSTSMTIIKDNEGDIEDVIRLIHEENVPFQFSKTIRKPIIENNVDRIAKIRVAAENIHHIKDGLEEFEIDEKYVLYPKQTNMPFSSCRCYKKSCIVKWNGNIVGCSFLNSISEDIRKTTLVDGFRNMWNRLDLLKQPDKCKDCKYLKFCNPCPGALEGETGNPELISEYICEKAKNEYLNCISRVLDNQTDMEEKIDCEG